MSYHCVGCGAPSGWDGQGMWAATCACGAIMLSPDTEDSQHTFPASLILNTIKKEDVPHIDYYLGLSDYESAEKLAMIKVLRDMGSIYSWECNKCIKKLVEREAYFYAQGLTSFNRHLRYHPDLLSLINKHLGGKENGVRPRIRK